MTSLVDSGRPTLNSLVVKQWEEILDSQNQPAQQQDKARPGLDSTSLSNHEVDWVFVFNW